MYRTIWATNTFKISPTIVHRIHDEWKSRIPALYKTYAYAKLSPELTFQSLPPVPRNGTPPNSLGFPSDSHPERDLVFVQIIFHFTEANATQGLTETLEKYSDLFNKLAEDEGVKSDWIYLNFAAKFQDPLKSYGKEVLGKLRKVAKEYDPKGFFQRQTDGFKLWRGNDTRPY